MTKLKPCPFCGEKNNTRHSCSSWLVNDESYWIGEITCIHCGLIIQKHGFPSNDSGGGNAVDGIIAVWNTRYDDLEKLNKDHCLHILAKCVADLWHAVAKGMYDARSFVGDTVLPMQESLLEIGIDVREKPLNTTSLQSNTRSSSWVSIYEDGPPEEDGLECIIILKRGKQKATWNQHYKCWDDADGDDHLCYAIDPTHYMPIPELPGEEK